MEESEYTVAEEAFADRLQIAGPDEYPRGYYLWLARKRIEEGVAQ